jgi:choline transport protein
LVSFILSLIYIGSSTAYNAILSLTAIGINISYVVPISFFMLRKSRSPPLAYGPFRLGRWGIPVNLASLAYLIFIIVWAPFPQVLPVTRETMNYAGPVLIVIILAALTDWQFSGHKRFQVPVPQNLPKF